MSAFSNSFAGRRVLVTGHTGFKGSWLCQWLLKMGAIVYGYAKDPPTSPSLFNDLKLSSRMIDIRGDVCDLPMLTQYVVGFEPEFIFHLAAQSLVRASYEIPVETYTTNVMGTVNLLESLRRTTFPVAVVVVTTDKCYENQEWPYGYREDDPMGGADPYSSSKGMAELAVAAWRRSFCSDGRVRLASVRAGNVIGGGDWAADRIVPDCVRAVQRSQSVRVRNPASVRPWQHVLEPLCGYMTLAARIDPNHEASNEMLTYCGGYNFGPDAGGCRTVLDVVDRLLKVLDGSWCTASEDKSLHEAKLLRLAVDKARLHLNWYPRLTFEESVQQTAIWYKGYLNGIDAQCLTDQCISKYESLGY